MQALREDGDHEIVGIARRRPPDEPPYAVGAWHTVDVAAPDAAEQLEVPFADADVVHLAWGSSRPIGATTCGRPGSRTRAVLAAAAAGGVGRVVHMSSSAVYAPGSYGAPRRRVVAHHRCAVLGLQPGQGGRRGRLSAPCRFGAGPRDGPARRPDRSVPRGKPVAALHSSRLGRPPAYCASRPCCRSTGACASRRCTPKRRRERSSSRPASGNPGSTTSRPTSRQRAPTSLPTLGPWSARPVPTAAGGRPGDVAAAPATRRRRLDRPGVLDSAH
ncbi:hypothetical protein GS531_06675 [Rhodococcus hoagii]|nr:hypothetical protein [Prescottella equi]